MHDCHHLMLVSVVLLLITLPFNKTVFSFHKYEEKGKTNSEDFV